MDLSTALDFAAFTDAIGDVLVVAVPVGLTLLAVSVGWKYAKRFVKSS